MLQQTLVLTSLSGNGKMLRRCWPIFNAAEVLREIEVGHAHLHGSYAKMKTNNRGRENLSQTGR